MTKYGLIYAIFSYKLCFNGYWHLARNWCLQRYDKIVSLCHSITHPNKIPSQAFSLSWKWIDLRHLNHICEFMLSWNVYILIPISPLNLWFCDFTQSYLLSSKLYKSKYILSSKYASFRILSKLSQKAHAVSPVWAWGSQVGSGQYGKYFFPRTENVNREREVKYCQTRERETTHQTHRQFLSFQFYTL